MENEQRKAFNFYRSYYEIAMELPKKERCEFLTALIKIQFTGETTELKGLARFAYLSQKHSIDKQLEGFKHGGKVQRPYKEPYKEPPKGNSTIPPLVPPPQVQGKEKVQEKEKEELSIIVEEKTSTYSDMMEIYNNFVIDKTGAKAKINGLAGKSLKLIISYLKSNIKDKEGCDEKIIEAWNAVLSNYPKWDDFYKKQLSLNQIESNLVNIINSIKNGNTTDPQTGKQLSKYA